MEILRSRVLLQPRDLDVSLTFYEGALGLHRSREFGRRPHRGIVFFLGGAELELTETTDQANHSSPQGVRLWLQVADVAEEVRRLEALGVSALQAPQIKPWGLVEATIVDPDGLPLVLVEVPPDHPLRRDTR